MDNSIYIGRCPICRGYGMLEIVINDANKTYSVMCDECFAEWKTPEYALDNRGGFRDSTPNVRVRAATIDEIKTQGWERFITNN